MFSQNSTYTIAAFNTSSSVQFLPLQQSEKCQYTDLNIANSLQNLELATANRATPAKKHNYPVHIALSLLPWGVKAGHRVAELSSCQEKSGKDHIKQGI